MGARRSACKSAGRWRPDGGAVELKAVAREHIVQNASALSPRRFQACQGPFANDLVRDPASTQSENRVSDVARVGSGRQAVLGI